MDITRAKELLSALADGIDPFTGELLPQNHVCNQPEMIPLPVKFFRETTFAIILISFALYIRYLVRHKKSKKAPVRQMQANLGRRKNKTSW